MGTSSIVIFKNFENKEISRFMKHYDGYPMGMGRWLKYYFEDLDPTRNECKLENWCKMFTDEMKKIPNLFGMRYKADDIYFKEEECRGPSDFIYEIFFNRGVTWISVGDGRHMDKKYYVGSLSDFEPNQIDEEG